MAPEEEEEDEGSSSSRNRRLHQQTIKLDQIEDPAGPQSQTLTQMITDYNLVNYTQPLVAVKFLNASLNTDINIECKVTSNTLTAGSERDKFAGRVSFKLRIDGQEAQ
ncbi:hypothetical protein CCH79_00020676 [Gambusia affinis]|uniref:Sodium/potassium-transporting ATPase subunit beta-2 n=1 Tax=Gambusia affinis TaxID=33528 RepID=A0A315WC37_GAMAF|nr:hypothetical protein CCH79_00020676 [Gambusia affinis]